jgi:hypothetical protein
MCEVSCAVDGHEREPALELRHIAAHLDKKHKGHTESVSGITF